MNARAEVVTDDGELVEAHLPIEAGNGGMVATLARAEIDAQVTTAKTYPRSIKRSSDNILSLATMDEETAAECMYALPRGGKPIKGPSVRLAETIAQQWGNNRVDARVISIDRVNKVVVAEGTFHDLETNSATRSVVQRRIVDRHGRIYNDDMIVVTGNAACSIARRNAILAGVPKAVWRRAYEAAEHVVAGDIKTLAERRESALKAFAAFGVKPEQIFGALGVAGLEDITLEHIPTLLGMHSALKNGEATVEEMFDMRKAGKAFEVVNNPLKDDPTEPAKTMQAAPPKEAAPKTSEAKAADATEKAATKPKAETKPAPDQSKKEAPADKAAISQGDDVHRGDAGDDLDDGLADGADEQTGTAIAPWPLDKAPTNVREYALYAVTYADKNRAEQEAVINWWKGPEQKKLRNTCGITQDDFNDVKAGVSNALNGKPFAEAIAGVKCAQG